MVTVPTAYRLDFKHDAQLRKLRLFGTKDLHNACAQLPPPLLFIIAWQNSGDRTPSDGSRAVNADANDAHNVWGKATAKRCPLKRPPIPCDTRCCSRFLSRSLVIMTMRKVTARQRRPLSSTQQQR